MGSALAGFVMGGVLGCEVGCIVGTVADSPIIGCACEELAIPCAAVGGTIGMTLGGLADDYRKMQRKIKEQRPESQDSNA